MSKREKSECVGVKESKEYSPSGFGKVPLPGSCWSDLRSEEVKPKPYAASKGKGAGAMDACTLEFLLVGGKG